MTWNPTTIWLILIIVFIAVELLTMGLMAVWGACGSIAGLVMSLAGLPLWAQITAAVALCIMFMVFIRPLGVRLFNLERRDTDNEELLGRDVIVVSEVDNRFGTGQITIDGKHLSASTKDPTEKLPVGSIATVVDIKGHRLMLKGKQESGRHRRR